MKKKRGFVVATICLCLSGLFIIGAIASEEVSIYTLLGEYYNESKKQESENKTFAETEVLAEYNGEKIYQSDVD